VSALAVALAFLVVIPEGDLLLFFPPHQEIVTSTKATDTGN
jgi:hypothetical protein